jgi:hypothetical protein
MAIVYTGGAESYTRLANNVGAGEGNWPNPNIGVNVGDLMVWFLYNPFSTDITAISTPARLAVPIHNETVFKMFETIADADDSAQTNLARYEFLATPETSVTADYREFPVANLSYGGVYTPTPFGGIQTSTSGTEIPASSAGRTGDFALAWDIGKVTALYGDLAGPNTPIPGSSGAVPAGWNRRVNGDGVRFHTAVGSPVPADTVTDAWWFRLYDNISAFGDNTGVTDPISLSYTPTPDESYTGVIVVNGSAPDGVPTQNVLPPGDKYWTNRG